MRAAAQCVQTRTDGYKMKLALKQTIFITILVSVLLTFGSIVIVQRSFDNSLETAVNRSVEQQLMEHYALKSSLLTDQFNGIAYSDNNVKRYVNRMLSGEQKLGTVGIFHGNGEVIITNLPSGISAVDMELLLVPENKNYVIRKIDDNYYMFMSAPITLEQNLILYMINGYNISYVFVEKQEQIQAHTVLNVCLVIVSGIAIAGLSFALTGPLQKLNKVSKEIASGDYGQRTQIKSNDEIGQLSNNFDRMATAVEQKVTELNEQVESRNRFIAAFSHEIKTPVTSIMGYADIMRKSPVEQEQQLQYANILYQESKRLEAMSQKMMMLLHVNDEQITLKPIPLESFIQKLWTSRKTSFADVELCIDIENTAILGEPDLLFSLISNLLDNAAKAEPKDHKIYLTGKLIGKQYQLQIKDNGSGISPEDYPHIQEIFYMADKSRTRAKGGSGVGLYLCNQIAKLHGGELLIESELQKGTCVSFSLEVYHV